MFTSDGFMYDYTNHLWLVGVQSDAIAAHALPTYFIHAPEAGGVFHPIFAFYGGTAPAASGAISAVLGGRPVAGYVLGILASIAAAYGGLLWIARQLGARSWMAHAPAVVYASSAYLVSNIYGRGDWTEVIATCAIPLLIASGLWVARAPHLRALPCATFILAAVFWSGSHNITLAWSVVIAIGTFLALRIALRRPLVNSRLRAGQLLALLAIGVGVNAWFLLPDVLYGTQTQIAATADFDWGDSRMFNTPAALSYPLRHAPQSGTPALYVQAPVWLLAWALAAGCVLRSRVSRELRRGAAAAGLVLAALLILIMVPGVWRAVPAPLQLIQFPLRLNSFVALAVAGLVLCAVLAAERVARTRERRVLGGLLAAAMSISIGLCVWQLWVPDTHAVNSYDDARDALTYAGDAPRTWYDDGAFLDAGARVVAHPERRRLLLDPAAITSDRVTLTVTPPPGSAPFSTNIAGGPNLVALDGLIGVGRTHNGHMVLRRPEAGDGPVQITIGRGGWAITVGALVSVLAVLGAVVALSLVARSARRERRNRSMRSDPTRLRHVAAAVTASPRRRGDVRRRTGRCPSAQPAARRG